MLNPQLQGQHSTASLSPSSETIQPCSVCTSSYFQKKDNRQHQSQADCHLDRKRYLIANRASYQFEMYQNHNTNDTSDVIRDLGMYQHQDSSDVSDVIRDFGIYKHQDSSDTSSVFQDLAMYEPSNNSDVSEDSFWNVHISRSNELGAKTSPIGESKLLPSAVGTVGVDEYRNSMYDNMCDSKTASATNEHDMNLDSALDELGLLSTVNSRRRLSALEIREHTSFYQNQHRLHCKYKSSPNLTGFSYPNGYRIIQLNSNFVTNLSNTISAPPAASIGVFDKPQLKPECVQLTHHGINVLEGNSRRKRSGPQLSRRHRDGHMYRLSRCPYRVPNRFCSSLQESDFALDNFVTNISSFETPALSTSPLSESGVDTLSNELRNGNQSLKSKSNTSSPLKPCVEMRLTRSLSAEDLTSLTRSLSAEDLTTTCRRLEQEFNEKCRESCSTEQSLDTMTSQMTNLHMS